MAPDPRPTQLVLNIRLSPQVATLLEHEAILQGVAVETLLTGWLLERLARLAAAPSPVRPATAGR